MKLYKDSVISECIMDDIIDDIVNNGYAVIIQKHTKGLLCRKNLTFDKKEIIKRYKNNVKGKEMDTSSKNPMHCGKGGHWLEEVMGIKPNGKNEPDIFGYEMKNDTKSGFTTFIDKQPDYFCIKGDKFKLHGNKSKKKTLWTNFYRQKTRKQDEKRIGGWKVDIWDIDGQRLSVCGDNSIIVEYNYEYDTRAYKDECLDNYYKDNKDHIILKWEKNILETCINRKFNQNGFFICKKYKICFGKPITFDMWIQGVKDGIIYYDGYSSIDGRWRGCFRAKNNYWHSLITEEY
jgi:hypothetical protein